MLSNLVAALHARRLRQFELARALGIPDCALSSVIAGRRELEPNLKERAAEILNADREWLFQHVIVIPPRKMPAHCEEAAAVASG